MDHDFPDFGFKGTTKPTFNSNPILLDPGYDDVFGGPPKYPNSSSPFDFDSMFKDSKNNTKSSSNLPVFDKPLYDHDDGGDIFDGVPGLKTSSSVKFDNSSSSTFDDLLGNLGKKERAEELKSGSLRNKWGEEDNNTAAAFDDLLPGFGASSPPTNRVIPGTTQPQQSSVASSISTPSVVENPFVVLEPASVPAYASSRLFAESLEQIDKASQSGSRKVEVSSVQGEIFDTDPTVNMAKSKPIFPSGADNKEKDGIGLGTSAYGTHTSTIREPSGEPSKFSENASQRKVSIDNFQKSHQSRFSMPTVSSDSHHTFTQNGPRANSSSETNSDTGMSPKSDDNLEAADDVWLTVSEITLTTLPTRVPPPSRPAPPRPQQNSRVAKDFSSANIKKPDAFSSFYPSSQSYGRPQTVPDAVKNPGFSSIDEFADFSMAMPQSDVDERGDVTSNVEDTENSSAAASAAAMKEAVDRAEAKFKHAREVRERENAAKNSGVKQEREEKVSQDFKERDQERLDREQEQRERDEKDREQRRIEKEREQAREIERQRETGRQAVDRATKEVRERAAAEARQKAQRAAVDKVNAGARERAERAAVQRAQAEARERAAKEARLRAEKAAAEAKERKNAEENEKTAAAASAEAEARIRAGRASVNRATAEARERAAAAASAAATRGNQQKNENDLDSFFNTSARPDSASRPRTSSSDSTFDDQFQDRPGPEGIQRSSTATTSGVRKASSTTNIADDLTSFFGSTTSSGDSQETGGESDERRRARLERNQRTQERAEKALAEKNERDRHIQWEQAERGRIAESLDFEIKRWSAGKEGNLRALLSTLQYVLWPECGWQPVSLTDLITSASVKKVYRKATLCIHPDKVQQKGANLQQKYIAEKVFDMLKEAWNKLNSEELF